MAQPSCLAIDEYAACGLGSMSATANPCELYLDAIKRAVTNILYEDLPVFVYDHTHRPFLAKEFSLRRRVLGEDGPNLAHTMIGIKRIMNLQHCVEDTLRNNVPGDLLEAGAFRGGASIFMRAVLKAHGVEDRRVIVCDAFEPNVAIPWLVGTVLKVLASFPSRHWHRLLFKLLQALGIPGGFPAISDPSNEMLQFGMWMLKHHRECNKLSAGGIDEVRRNFAKYGLLDEQVVFVKGFFADTLPRAPIERLAILRIDADTYESTLDALTLLYPKLSPGGFCIIDDYGSFPDCRRATSEFRAGYGIPAEIVAIDNLGVYWQKGRGEGKEMARPTLCAA
jgi:hypothetical protein